MAAPGTILQADAIWLDGTKFKVLGGIKPSAIDQMVTTVSIGEGDSTKEEKASKWFYNNTRGGFGRYQFRPGSGMTADRFWDASVRTDSDEITLLPNPTVGFDFGGSTNVADAIEWGTAVYFLCGTKVRRYEVLADRFEAYCTTHNTWEAYASVHAEMALAAAGTSFDVFEDELIAWYGTGFSRHNGSTWTVSTDDGSYSTAYDGNCVVARPDGTVWKSTDLTAWTQVGSLNSEVPTSICVFHDNGEPAIYVGTQKRPWIIDIYGPRCKPTMVMFSDRHADNCRGMAPFNADLMIPKGAGLRRYSPASTAQMTDIGLTQGDGLPSTKVGRIVDLDATMENMLIAAVDAGASGVSGVYFQRDTSWHPLVEADVTGARIRAVAFSSLNAVPRVWYGQGTKVCWVPWFDTSSNPWQLPAGMTYKSSGSLITCWFGAPEFNSTAIDHRLLMRGLSQTEYIEIYAAYNNDDTSWLLIGTVTNNGARIVSFNAGGQKFRTIRLKITLYRGADASKTPRISSAALRWTPAPRILMGYAFDLDLTNAYGGKKPHELEEALFNAADGRVVAFSYRPGVTKYVRIEVMRGIGQTGQDNRVRYTLSCSELVPTTDSVTTLIWSNDQLWDGSAVWG